MKNLLTIRNILIAIPAIMLFFALHYALPQVDVLRSVGVEIKRVDDGQSEGGQNQTRDVYHIQMETLDGEPRVYRNEDNLLYFKFDSADLQAQIQSLAADKQVVALRHYGWRLTLFSRFPNALKAWPVEEGYRHIPVFNTIVVIGLGLIIFFIYRRTSKAITKSRQALENRRAEREAAAASKAESKDEPKSDASKKEEEEAIRAFVNSDNDKKI